MPENNRRKYINTFKTFLISAVIFIVTVLAVFLISLLKGNDMTGIIRNSVMSGIGIFAVLFLLAYARDKSMYDYGNEENYAKFFVVYVICLCLALACVYIPPAGWPFLAVFVSLSLFSNTIIGILSGSFLLVLSVMLSGSGTEIFLLYFICGLMGASLFKSLDESYKTGVPVIVSALFLLTGETACVVLYANQTLKWELFLLPLMNVILSIILLLVILKIFSLLVIFRYRDKYMVINDPECVLLVELKDHYREAYYQAVHTAYFCDRIAHRLSLDADAVKTGGYYHRIGLLKGENTWDFVKETAKEHAFPPKAKLILQEFLDNDTPIRQKETAVLLLSDAVVSSILYLFAKEQDGHLDYDQVIDAVFKKKLSSNVLNECQINMAELTLMKKIFKEEKLYYDFLR